VQFEDTTVNERRNAVTAEEKGQSAASKKEEGEFVWVLRSQLDEVAKEQRETCSLSHKHFK
jgi:flagellar hook-basal body complex protein FliE